jgi:hypothetical protein
MESSQNISSIAESFYKGTQVINNFCETEIIPKLKSNKSQEDKDIAITGIYYRMFLLVSSASLLNSYKYYQSIASIARSLFELYLDINIIISDSTDNSVKKFIKYPEVDKYRAASKIVNYVASNPESSIDVSVQKQFLAGEDKRISIESMVEEYWGRTRNGKLNWPNHWTGKNVKQRASDLGKEYEEFYFEYYPQLSWHIHSVPTGYANMPNHSFEYMFVIMHNLMQKTILKSTTLVAYHLRINKTIDDFDSNIIKLSKISRSI